MTADDQRYTLREAADLTDKSVDTLRRCVKSGKLPGGQGPGRPDRHHLHPAPSREFVTVLAFSPSPTGLPDSRLPRSAATRRARRPAGREARTDAHEPFLT